MRHYLYLLIDLASILLPLIFSFDKRINFYRQWKAVWPAILLPAILFISWDQWFTAIGVWGFNPAYLTGSYFLYLPVEEVLFFVCIPYACLFTYAAVKHFKKTDPLPNNGERITWVLIAGLLLTGLKYYDRWYPAVTCLSLAAFLVYLQLIVRAPYLGKFYFSYFFILIPFFIVNGLLTGTGLPEPVVWYNDTENLGIRMGTIPFEDTFYGMLLILMNVSIFEYFQKRSTSAS